jgi:hypothetical protein
MVACPREMESRKQASRKLRSKYRARENTGMRVYGKGISTIRKSTEIRCNAATSETMRRRIAVNLQDERSFCRRVLVEITVVLPGSELTLGQESAIKQITWHSKKPD